MIAVTVCPIAFMIFVHVDYSLFPLYHRNNQNEHSVHFTWMHITQYRSNEWMASVFNSLYLIPKSKKEKLINCHKCRCCWILIHPLCNIIYVFLLLKATPSIYVEHCYGYKGSSKKTENLKYTIYKYIQIIYNTPIAYAR